MRTYRLCSLSPTTKTTKNRVRPGSYFLNLILPKRSIPTQTPTPPARVAQKKKKIHPGINLQPSKETPNLKHVPQQLPPQTPRPPPRPAPVLPNLPAHARPAPPGRRNRLVHLRAQRPPRRPARYGQRQRPRDLPGAPRRGRAARAGREWGRVAAAV
jgi:hypothetical protein